ncbi:hypothetical protein ACEZCY_32140 [Streptacidiphilus sp. N1-12]|uniref:Uncharacterized protein n=2 Tax=Streptacidiphilus alkalitolerans TaxID=3342712 RepID=A0ABV6XAE4_9ACTN
MNESAPVEDPIREAYAFACLNCGFGWEQAYEILHLVDVDGRPRAQYRANGVPVPSPLTQPSCPGCAGNHVRIMRAGRVAEVASYWHPAPVAAPAPRPAAPAVPSHAPARPRRERRLHLPFHLHLRRNHHGTPEA